MRLKFLAPLREGRGYEGIIRNYEVKNGIIRIYVELADEPDNLYLSSQRMIMRKCSPFYNFCRNMGVLDNDLNLDCLIDLPVWVAFKRGKDDNMYICDMCIKEEEEGDDEE